MAIGKTHKRFNFLIGLPIGIFFLFYLNIKIQYQLIFGLAFILNTLLVNPDLDILDTRKLSFYWAPIYYFFYPYAYFFRHRGLSHHFFLGTLVRFSYLVGPAYFIYPYFMVYRSIAITIFFALFYGDLLHLLLDHMPTRMVKKTFFK